MNTHKIECSEEKQESINDYCSFNFLDDTCQNFGSRQLWNRGFCFQSPLPEGTVNPNIPQWLSPQSPNSVSCLEGCSPQPDLMPASSSCSPLNCFQSQSSAFFVGDRYPGFPSYVYQVSPLPVFSQFSPKNSTESPSRGPSADTSPVNFTKQNDLDSLSRDTIQSVEKFPSYGNQNSRISDYCSRIQSRNFQGSEPLPFMQSKMIGEDAILGGRNLNSVDGIRSSSIGFNPINSTITPSNFQSPPEKQLLRPSGGVTSTNASSGVSMPNKTRIRWTQDLHERFVESVNQLGGAEKATPKGILKLMDHDGLTIFHVKSHLQKYRIAKYIPDSAEVKFERKTNVSDIPQLDLKASMQITEALRLQLDVQRCLHEQLETQRKLQMQIEKQGKQLQKMIEEQQKTKMNLLETQNLDILFQDEHLVSLEDVLVSDVGEGCESTHFPSKIS